MTTALDEETLADELVHKWIQRYRRGSLRFFILHLLLHQPYRTGHRKGKKGGCPRKKISFHGYKIAKEISDATRGKWKPTTSSIYPILKELMEKGVLEKTDDPETHESTRMPIGYQLTPFGKIVARKFEKERKEFARSFIRGRPKSNLLHPSPFKGLSREELIEEFKETDTERLEEHYQKISEIIKYYQEILTIINEELKTRKKEKV
ncbi:MAG: PadR family transcriptional regulator [Candidatus Hodarchaeales archaeon]